MTNFNGQVVSYEYDVNNRPSAQRFPGGKSIGFTYTPTGRRQTITDSRGVTSFTYDARDRLLVRTDPDGRSVQYEYDLAGNRTKIITHDPVTTLSSTQSFAYDALNRLLTTTAADGGMTTYAYDAANNLVSVGLPNGTVRTNVYDPVNRLTTLEHRAGTNVLFSQRYIVDTGGNRLAVQQENGRQLRYDYDLAQRLTDERVFNDPAGSNRTNRYTYDAAGNRVTFDSSVNVSNLTAESSAYAYDANDRLLAETNLISGEVTTYAYDNNGNTLARSNSLQSAEYFWSADGRLLAATITDGGGVHQLTYDYNPDGVRVGARIVENGNTNRINYLVDANRPNAQVLEEWSSLNNQPANLSAAYVYGTSLISQDRAGTRSYFHPDGLGSTRVLTDGNGLPTDRYEYDAFGRITAQTGTTANDYLFAGEQRDRHLDLDYLRARYMAPGLGRFYGRDPAEGDLTTPSRRHPYIYAGNDPVNKLDPSGRQFDLASVSVSLAINTSIEQYQVGFARAGVKAIARSARIADHLIRPGIQMQYLGLTAMESGAPGGEEMFSLGMELEQTGYRLLQSVIAGIYVETFNTAKIGFVVGPLKAEFGLVSGSISLFGKKAEYGKEYADYAETLDKILESTDKQIKNIEGVKLDTDLSDGAKQLEKYINKALDKISKGPTEKKYGGGD